MTTKAKDSDKISASSGKDSKSMSQKDHRDRDDQGRFAESDDNARKSSSPASRGGSHTTDRGGP